VRNGLALDWPEHSKGDMVALSAMPNVPARGIWKGSHVEPWLYRACIRAKVKSSACSDDAAGGLRSNRVILESKPPFSLGET
jgi:hypothetical protein